MAINIDELNDLLTQAGIELEKRKLVLKEAEELEQEKKDEKAANKGPKATKEFVVIIRGEPELKDKIQQAWIVQRKAEADNSCLVNEIKEVAREFNVGQKRQKRVVNAFRDVFRYVKRSFWKPKDIMVKTKEPVQVVIIEKEYINE